MLATLAGAVIRASDARCQLSVGPLRVRRGGIPTEGCLETAATHAATLSAEVRLVREVLRQRPVRALTLQQRHVAARDILALH